MKKKKKDCSKQRLYKYIKIAVNKDYIKNKNWETSTVVYRVTLKIGWFPVQIPLMRLTRFWDTTSLRGSR